MADFVEADDAYLVRANAVPSAARTLSSRLGVGILTPDDLASMVRVFPTELDLESGPLACMFDLHGVGAHLDSHSGLSRKLAPLVDYLDFDYWVYEPYRNLTQVVAHLSDAAGTLNPDDRVHRTLFYDCAWHYALAIVRALAFVRSTRMADVPAAVRIYAAGGELALREKNQMAKLLARNGFDIDSGVVHPPYIDSLITLITRFLVHPSELADVLRYAEYLGVAEITRVPETVGQAFGASVRPVAAKLFADICSFLVTSAGLRPEFKSAARDRSVVDLTGGVPSNLVPPGDAQQESGDQLTIPDS
ncbi:hypothetical protein ABZ733_36835 [Streptomyces longwoodensis]|uniref:hypothetical protein n=1 Tax=Streptomyces longwoodensis TaxID=68231 RepID=UPI0033D63ACB